MKLVGQPYYQNVRSIMKQNLVTLLFATALSVVGFTACNKDDDSGTNTSKATVGVHLTDGPADYDAIYLDVEAVELKTESNANWVALPLVRTGFYDILRFRNGADTLLGRVELPVGRLSEMRLILGDDSYLVEDGQAYDLKVPSGQSSGLKVKMDETLVAGGAYDFWLDFDAGKSVHQTGNGQYMLKPVVRGYTALSNGRIRGYVLPLAAGTTVYAYNGVDTFSAIPGPDGFYLISGVPAGTYTLHYDATAGTFNDVILPAVVVSHGAITELGTQTLLP
jgi:hypothetical protein